MIRALCLACLAAAIVLAPLAANAAPLPGPYLYEQLRLPTYKTTFMALFKGQPHVEPWVTRYLANRDGVEGPMERRFVGGAPMEFYSVCQPHNCGGNFLYVLFEPGGTHAWVLFVKDDGTQRFFGNPDGAMQAALMAEAQPQ